MLELLRSCSRVEAFHGSSDYLAERLGLQGKATVGRILKRLKQAGKIFVHTRRTDETGQWRCWRRIYLVSEVPPEVGAVQLCLLVMELGLVEGTSQDVVKLCGRLQCTPEQLSTWAEIAERKRWLELSREPWRLVVPGHQRTTIWDLRERLAIRLPNRRVAETRDRDGKLIKSTSTWRPLPMPVQRTTLDLLRTYLTKVVGFQGHTLETNVELGRAIGRSAAAVKVALEALCSAREFHRTPVSAPGCKKGRIISRAPLSNEAAASLGRPAGKASNGVPPQRVRNEIVNLMISNAIAAAPARYAARRGEWPKFALSQREVNAMLIENGWADPESGRATEMDLADRVAMHFLRALEADAVERRRRREAHRVVATAAAVRTCAANLLAAAARAGLIAEEQRGAAARAITGERDTVLTSLATERDADAEERGVMLAANVVLAGAYRDWTSIFRSVVPREHLDFVAGVLEPDVRPQSGEPVASAPVSSPRA